MNHILPDRMNRVQLGHRPSTNDHLLSILQENPNRWFTSNDLTSMMGYGVTRSIGRRLNIIMGDHPELECAIDDATRKRYYRYNTAEETNEE